MRQCLPPKLLTRARGDDPMEAQVTVVAEDVQVAAKPRRRTYTAEYKRRILKEADACTTPGAMGALLRREGVDFSPPVGGRGAPGARPPGPPPAHQPPRDAAPTRPPLAHAPPLPPRE